MASRMFVVSPKKLIIVLIYIDFGENQLLKNVENPLGRGPLPKYGQCTLHCKMRFRMIFNVALVSLAVFLFCADGVIVV